MKVGSKSVLFGVHCFLIHPWFVALSWIRLYGFPWDPRIWVAFFVHDLGYWGKPNMDGQEGQSHPELGGRIMHRLFDWGVVPGSPYYNLVTGKATTVYHDVWGNFSRLHSRYYAAMYDEIPSKLCAADKLAFCFEPYWFYMLRARLSGEIDEYLLNSGRFASTKYTRKRWHNETYKVFIQWTAANYKNLGPRELKNGDYIRMTYMPPCRNGHGSPNPYIGMEGVVHDLDNGKFSILTKGGAWLCCLDLKTDKFEYL